MSLGLDELSWTVECQLWAFQRKLAIYKPVTLYVIFFGHHHQTIVSEIHLILWNTFYCLPNSFLSLDCFKFFNGYVICCQNSDKFSGIKIEDLLLYVYFKPQKPQSFNAIPLLIREATLTSISKMKNWLKYLKWKVIINWTLQKFIFLIYRQYACHWKELSRYADYYKEPLWTCQLSPLFWYLNSLRPSDAFWPALWAFVNTDWGNGLLFEIKAPNHHLNQILTINCTLATNKLPFESKYTNSNSRICISYCDQQKWQPFITTSICNVQDNTVRCRYCVV